VSILVELTALLQGMGIAVETGVFSDVAPDEYIVITPLADTFALHASDRPGYDQQEARLSLHSKGNYLALKRQITNALIHNNFTITARQYIGREDETGYFHAAIDAAKLYEME
jgi:hypothetical protein